MLALAAAVGLAAWQPSGLHARGVVSPPVRSSPTLWRLGGTPVIALATKPPSKAPKSRKKGAKAAAPPPPAETFAELGCAPELVASLANAGIHRPMEAQLLSYHPLRETTQDTVLIAEAGSGKTLAYLVPLVDKILKDQVDRKAKATAPIGDASPADTQEEELPMSNTQRRIQKLQANLEKEARTKQEKRQRAQQEEMLEELLQKEARRLEAQEQKQRRDRRLHVVVPSVDLEAQVRRAKGGWLWGWGCAAGACTAVWAPQLVRLYHDTHDSLAARCCASPKSSVRGRASWSRPSMTRLWRRRRKW